MIIGKGEIFIAITEAYTSIVECIKNNVNIDFTYSIQIVYKNTCVPLMTDFRCSFFLYSFTFHHTLLCESAQAII